MLNVNYSLFEAEPVHIHDIRPVQLTHLAILFNNPSAHDAEIAYGVIVFAVRGISVYSVKHGGKEYFEGKARGSLEKIEKVSPLLTRQEKRILEKLLQQKSNEEIAGELFISLHTVENYVSYIYDKLCVKSRAELEAAFG